MSHEDYYNLIAGRSVLGVIPARGGSVAVPGKNLREVRGKPLVAWTIEAARSSRYLDRLILSSEDEEIAAAAHRYGCDVPFARPTRLAADETPMIDVILDALKRVPGFDVVVVLQPTSPLREAEDIDAALELQTHSQAPTCVSVAPAAQSPYWMYSINEDGRLTSVLGGSHQFERRQDLPTSFVLNGAVYVADAHWLQRSRTLVAPDSVGYVMPVSRSLDIDDPEDFVLLEAFLRN